MPFKNAIDLLAKLLSWKDNFISQMTGSVNSSELFPLRTPDWQKPSLGCPSCGHTLRIIACDRCGLNTVYEANDYPCLCQRCSDYMTAYMFKEVVKS